MREILFKAKCIDGAEWVEGSLFSACNGKRQIMNGNVGFRFCVWLDGATSAGVNRYLADDIEVIGNVYDKENSDA